VLPKFVESSVFRRGKILQAEVSKLHRTFSGGRLTVKSRGSLQD
jgi:hypothetical protein